MQTELLISRGLKRVGCIHSDVPGFTANRERFEGYCEAMRRHSLPATPSCSLDLTDLDRDVKESVLKSFLLSDSRPEGVVCDTDFTAVKILAMARDLGVKVPDDFSVVGFGNIVSYAELVRPRLTSFEQRPAEIGRTAAAMLIEAIENGKGVPAVMERRIPVELVERGSVRN